jgi:hypothetical protein
MQNAKIKMQNDNEKFKLIISYLTIRLNLLDYRQIFYILNCHFALKVLFKRII